MFAPNPNRPLRQTLMLSLIVIGAAALGAVVLYGVTSWLGVVVHQGLR
jgi:multisubunit Na+/H+ antiporter MnhC subunit